MNTKQREMDSIEIVEIVDQIEKPLSQAKKNLISIKNDKEISTIKEAKKLIEKIDGNLSDITTKMKEFKTGGPLTINDLGDDVKKMSSNAQEFKKELKKTRIDQFSRMNVASLALNAKQIKNITNKR